MLQEQVQLVFQQLALQRQELQQQEQLVFQRQELQEQEQLVLQQQELLELGCWWFQLAFQLVSQLAGNQRKEPSRKQPTIRITSSSSFSLQFFCEPKTNVNQKQFAAQKLAANQKRAACEKRVQLKTISPRKFRRMLFVASSQI